jgi:putative transposase
MGSTRRSESSTLAGASAEGLFRAGDGTLVNADVNGSYNIIQKAFPKAFEGIEGVPVVHPVRVEPS